MSTSCRLRAVRKRVLHLGVVLECINRDVIRQTYSVVALTMALATPALSAQSLQRIDASPVVGAVLFLRQLPDSFQINPNGKQANLRAVGLNDALLIGGHLNFWLSSSIGIEASAAFTPSRLHDKGTTSVDVSAFTLGGRFVIAEARRARPYLTAGVGAKRYDFIGAATGRATHFAFSGGAGIVSPVTQEIRVRADLRDCVSVFTSETDAASRVQHDLILTVGFDLALWQRRTSASILR